MAASMPVLALGTHVAEEGDLSSREEAGAYVLHSFLQAVMTAEIKRLLREWKASWGHSKRIIAVVIHR